MSRVTYKKFLPLTMRNSRWADLITVYQDVIADLKTEQIDALKNKFDINLMSEDEIFEVAAKFGFKLLSFDGYTSTNHYLKKEISTIALRIMNKNTRSGYKYIYYIFNLVGDIYPIQYVNNSTFNVLDNYWNETSIIHTQLFTIDPDVADTLDSSTGLWISTLDQSMIDYVILRHLVLNYTPKYVESASEFLSLNTLKCFANDVTQMKRATEIPYFEHKLESTAYFNKTLYTTTFYNYDKTLSTTMKSIFLTGSGLMNFGYIEIGNGTRTTFASGTISGVVSLVGTIKPYISGTLGMLQFVKETTNNEFYARRLITEKNTFPAFTEIALKNQNSGCMFYATFPRIQWDPQMYGNVLFKINLV